MKLRRSYNPFSAYAELPRGVGFSDQKADEAVVLLLRQHAIVNLRWIVFLSVGLIVPIVLYFTPWDLDPAYWSQPVLDSLLLIWYVGLIGFSLEVFLVWYYNVYIVSNRRVIDNEFKGLLQFSSSEAGLGNIENVVHSQRGTWQLLFDYGDVNIKTAAAASTGGGVLTFSRVPKPARVASVLNELLAESRKRGRRGPEGRAEQVEPEEAADEAGGAQDVVVPMETFIEQDERPVGLYKVLKGSNRDRYKRGSR